MANWEEVREVLEIRLRDIGDPQQLSTKPQVQAAKVGLKGTIQAMKRITVPLAGHIRHAK